MNHNDHVNLIAQAVPKDSGGTWADLGAGSGAFTLALRDLAGPTVDIYAVDRDRQSLDQLQSAMQRAFPGTNLHPIGGDFTAPLTLPELDGIVIANALHFERDQRVVLQSFLQYLAPGGRLIVVEYDADSGNRWVPYPISAHRMLSLATQSGFIDPTVIGHRPSRFLGGIYAAIAFAP